MVRYSHRGVAATPEVFFFQFHHALSSRHYRQAYISPVRRCMYPRAALRIGPARGHSAAPVFRAMLLGVSPADVETGGGRGDTRGAPGRVSG